MAYNRKMRKFEGTCYIPGEQLAMMAKYYRGANLNLNLTLFEDDLATMQETLNQACWCSKLDDLDRMKMTHMKGNEWRLAHEHCVDRQGPDGMDPHAHPAFLQNSKSTVSKVDRGTSAVSLCDRERGVVRGGRYQRDDYPEWQSRWGDNDYRTYKRNEPGNRRVYYPAQSRDDYKVRYPRDDYPGPCAYPAQVERTGRNMGGPTDDCESDAPASSMPVVTGEIRCAVCNIETCLVCKNHVNSPVCACKCSVTNAGLCNKCNPCEEDEQVEQVAQECADNKVDMSSMMLTMMMSSMFKQSQCPESVCCCKPSRDNSGSSSTDSSDEKVHKVYLYDCEDTKKSRKFQITSRKPSSDVSSACDCCKCSRKPKKPPGKAGKSPKSKDEETSESDRGRKPNQSKKKEGKGKDSYGSYIGGESNSEHVKPSKENNKKSKSSREDSRKSEKSESTKPSKMKDHKGIDSRSIDSRNVQLAKEHDERSQLPQNSPPKQSDAKMSELSSIPDLEGNSEGRDDSSTTFNLREFTVCLPKIQSHLQRLMYKLNQMSHLNQEKCPQLDTIMTTAQFHPERSQSYPTLPLISQPQNPPHSLYRGEQNEYDSGISPKLSPGNLRVQVSPPSTSQRISIEEAEDETNLNSSARYHSFENVPLLGMKIESVEKAACEKQQTIRIPVLSGSTEQAQPAFKFSPVVGSREKNGLNENGNQWSSTEEKQMVQHPASTTFQHIYQHAQQSYLKDTYQNVEIIELCDIGGRDQHDDQAKEQAKAHSVASRLNPGRETIYQSYNRETSGDTSELVPTEYASFAEEKTLQESPESSELQITCLRKDLIVDKSKNKQSQVQNVQTIISKFSPTNCEEKTSDNTRSILKTPKVVTFTAKQRDQISLEKLPHRYAVCGDKGSAGGKKIDVTKPETIYSSEQPTVLNQGVGPGKFCRSKSDSSLDYSKIDTSKRLPSQGRPETTQTPTGRNTSFIDTPIADEPLKKGFSPVEEKAGYTVVIKKDTLLPNTKDPQRLHSEIGSEYIPPDCVEEQTDSTLKMSNAYVRQKVGMGDVSSIEVKTINDRSTTDILKMVHGIASSSIMNTTNSSVPCPTAAFTSEDFNIIPLLPISSTCPGDVSDSRNENHLGDANIKEQVSFENEVSPNAPAFLRKSRVQVEKLKRAHDTIRAMIRNVNDVIAHIDSDSKIGIKSKARNEGNNRLSYFTDQEGVDKMRHSQFKPQDTRIANIGRLEGKYEGASIRPSCSSDIENQEVQKMFMSVDRVLNSALTPSEQSSTIPESEDHWPLENATPTRAHRDYFILDSESSGAAFTDSLRRSLEKEASRSLPLAALRIPSSQLIGPSERLRSKRPLKRRSWCYLPSEK